MSEKMWDVTYKHASTCEMGNKLYISQGDNYTLFLNPICQAVRAIVDDQVYDSVNNHLTIHQKVNHLFYFSCKLKCKIRYIKIFKKITLEKNYIRSSLTHFYLIFSIMFNFL